MCIGARLRVCVPCRCRSGIPILLVRGELDEQTVVLLGHAADLVLSGQPGDLLLDLSGVSFIGAAGLNALVARQREQAGAGYSLDLSNGTNRHRRVFTAGGLSDLLPSDGSAHPVGL